MIRLQIIVACFTAFLLAGPAVRAADDPATAKPPQASEMPKLTWDQIANIKSAAETIGKIQRRRGAKGAYDFIAACYKTQGLAETYSAQFESCIAQDYMQTQVLARIYSRMTPEQLANMRAPSAGELADAMGRRIVAAFKQYDVPATYGDDLKKLVDVHGFPVFLALVFPGAKVPASPLPNNPDGAPVQNGKPAN